ncbi:MAG TPA: SGNH/GDSL hydrolase family protein [Actinomycetota bacterium]
MTELVSLSSSGMQGNGPSEAGDISDDGRFVAFSSEATNFLESDADGSWPDIYVRDRSTGTTSLVSKDIEGNQADGFDFGSVTMSANGRYVTFTSDVPLVPEVPADGDACTTPQAYVFDRWADVPLLVSADSNGNPGRTPPPPPGAVSVICASSFATVSDRGDLALQSNASGLVADDTNLCANYDYLANCADAFVRQVPNHGPSIQYFGIGDSIPSGHGLGDDLTACKRSTSSYPYLVNTDLRLWGYETDFLSSPSTYHIACSGAQAVADPVFTPPPEKQLTWQVDRVLERRDSNKDALVSITIGADDFHFAFSARAMLCDASESVFRDWLENTVSSVREGVLIEVRRLLADTRTSVILTEYYQPFNKTPAWLQLDPLALPPFRPCDLARAHQRAQTAVQALNSSWDYIRDELASHAQQRLSITRIYEEFQGHEGAPSTTYAAAGVCGWSPPLEDQTWIQVPGNGYTTSMIPFVDGGDCFHPNEVGQRRIADAALRAASQLGF